MNLNTLVIVDVRVFLLSNSEHLMILKKFHSANALLNLHLAFKIHRMTMIQVATTGLFKVCGIFPAKKPTN